MNEDRIIKVRFTSISLYRVKPKSYYASQSANYVRTELPVRIAHRVRDMQVLPYVVVTQEQVARVYEVRASSVEMSNNHIDSTSTK